MECPNCGCSNFDSRGYCVECGVTLSLRCHACGGWSPVGKRFCGDCGAAFAPVTRTSHSNELSNGQGSKNADAERRQLTVMFCDLVGSTALSARLDPEELRNVLRAYQTCASEVIARYDGIAAGYSGDGILAYFGYPKAHEDDAEQAIYAGLGLVEAISNLRTDDSAKLQVRIGIATGLVVVGDVIGEGGAQEQAAFGEAPNLAARLQMLAEPGTVVICGNTRRLTGGHFEYRDLHPVQLKGFADPVLASQVLGTTGIESRFEAQHSTRLTPLLGRSEEIELLLRRWGDAEQGQGRAVVLTGEPGIGKSHIALALRARLQNEAHTSLRYFCSAHHANSALYPFIGQLERAARFDRSDSPAEKISKLEALIGPTAKDANLSLVLLADLLSVPLGDQYSLPDWSPQKRKEKTFEMLLDSLYQLAAQKPVLVIFEDVHWIDPTSLELLAQCVERAPQLPILVLITARPEFAPPWPGHAHVTTMSLTRFSRKDGAALVEQVTAGKSLPLEVMDPILARTDGVPLFIEELTKTVLESGLVQERDGHYVLDRPLPPLAIPTTLHASLIARLDRSPIVKEVAHIGAAIGRQFSYELLSTVAGFNGEKLHEALGELVRSGLVFCRGEVPQAIYTFKHVLVRDVAYAGLLKSRRAELHAAIAGALEHQFPELVQTQPETVAHHLDQAGLPGKAMGYWLQAGKNAARRSANLEAIAHLEQGIEAVGRLPGGLERDRLELDLQFALGPCLIATRGPASSEAVATFGRARELCDRLGDPPYFLQVPEYLNVMFWLATAALVRGELPQALEATKSNINMAEARGDRPALLNAMRGNAMVLLFMGEVDQAREMLDRFIGKFDTSTEPDRREAGRAVGQDPKVAGLSLMSWALWLLGHEDQADEKTDEAVKRAGEIQHPHTQAYVYYYAAVLHALRGQTKIAIDYAERCFNLSEEHGFRPWSNLSRAIRSICKSVENPSASELEEVTSALNDYRRAGYRFGLTALYALLGGAQLQAGRPEAALDVIDKGLSTAKQNTERIFEAELYRQRARALLDCAAPGAKDDARSLLELALETAKRHGTRSLELRVLKDLDEFKNNRSKRGEGTSIASHVARPSPVQ